MAAAMALTCAVAVAGCGLGPGASSSGTATLTVTSDYGSKTMLEASEENPPASETVIRMLDDEADIATRYGGGFVQSIDGLAGGAQKDWFFYVNGVESPVGAAEVHVEGGDRIWWDYRDWSAAMSVPAVVGSWPEPFAQESVERPRPVGLECPGVPVACQLVKDRLAAAGVKVGGARTDKDSPRLLVGTWAEVRRDPAVDGLRNGPQGTGVFATFKRPVRGGPLIGLDPTGAPARDLGSAGLVAALGRPPTWIVTASRRAGVLRAARALRERLLRNRYAIAATKRGPVPLPIVNRARAQ